MYKISGAFKASNLANTNQIENPRGFLYVVEHWQ